jgi:multiple sugar transport system substrate-binding protein
MISQGPSICIFNKEDSQEVLASWIFAQFMLTNSVQISYAQTEGYVPVTLKAQNSDEYQDYLSREGEDNDFYYDIKLKATKLLLDNTENTFVTPVFNGSMSLRNAAGELIESVNKSVRRKETIDDKYFEKLFADVSSLYRLDQGLGMSGKQDLGPLPPTSIGLIAVLGGAWLVIGVSYVAGLVKERKKNK